MKLKQTKQCKTCPWKLSTTVKDIPNYQIEKHEGLASTIAVPGDASQINKPFTTMACHYSTDDKDLECIGWLHNQIGTGNNLPLRMRMMFCENIKQIKIDGEQKNSFSDTFQ